MPVANTLQKPSFPVGILRLRPDGSGLTIKPLGLAMGSLPGPMADLKRDAGMAVTAFFAGLRASVPTLVR